MARGHRFPPGIVPIVLLAVLLGCFSRLVADPTGLLVDPVRPSLDQNDRGPSPPAIGNDATRLFIPHHAAIAARLARSGHVPTWDDRGFGGRPLVGNPQSGVFYPPTWLAWRIWAPSTLGWFTVAHLLFAGLGTYVLARSVRTSRWGSVAAAGCFQASPYVLGQTFAGHLPHVWAACWFPWITWLAILANRGHTLAGLALAPALALSLLAGHVQEPYLLLVALASWQLAVLWRVARTQPARVVVRRLRLLLGIAALTLGMTAIEWWPEVLVAPWTLRDAPFPSDFAGRYHLFPANLLQLVNPFALGRPATYFGHDNYWEALTSIGLIPLSLVLAAVAGSPRRRAVRGWAVLVLLATWFAAGPQLGFFSLLYELVPGLGRFRVPARSLFLASLGASVLAGFGVDALVRRSKASALWPSWSRTITRGIVLLVVLVGLANLSLPANPLDLASVRGREWPRLAHGFRHLGHEPVFWLAVVSLAAVAEISRRRPTARPSLALVLALLGLVELSLDGASLLVVAPAEQFLGPDPVSAAVFAADPDHTAPIRVRAVDSWFDDLRAQDRGLHKTNLNDSFQIRHAAGVYESLYRAFVIDPQTPERPMDAVVVAHRRAIQQAVFDRLGVRLLLTNRATTPFPWTSLGSGSWRGSPYLVSENPTALPRAYVVPRAQSPSFAGGGLAEFIRTDPRSVVLMGRDPLPPGTDRQTFTPARWLEDSGDHVVLSVTTRAPGLLVVSDTWMPGWSAWVDGRPTTIERGDVSQRVVPLFAGGTHRIDLRYSPPGLAAGRFATIATLLAWMAIVMNEVGVSPRCRRSFPTIRKKTTSGC